MVTYEQAKEIAGADGQVYCSADAGDFYVFIIVDKGVNVRIPDLLTGSTYTAVDKKDGRVWVCRVTDPRLKNAKKIEGV